MKEHRSGFPAVTVDCGDIHVLTDILSVEAWWQEQRETELKGGKAMAGKESRDGEGHCLPGEQANLPGAGTLKEGYD